MRISERLLNIISLMESCNLLMDIGCDHAYVPIEALQRSIAKRAVAVDVRTEPLRNARMNVTQAGLSGSIDLILSDGFRDVPPVYQPDCLVISGMGASLIVRILEEARGYGFYPENMSQIILGAQSEQEKLRRYIYSLSGLSIYRERIVFEDGIYYFLTDVRTLDRVSGEPGDEDSLFGHQVTEKESGVYTSWLHMEEEKYLTALSNCRRGSSLSAKERVYEMENKLCLIRKRIKEVSTDGIQTQTNH